MKLQVHDRIAAARRAAKLSQNKMAFLLGVARQTYISMENGDTDPKFSRILKICQLTGVSIEWIAYGNSGQRDRKAQEARKLLEQAQQIIAGI